MILEVFIYRFLLFLRYWKLDDFKSEKMKTTFYKFLSFLFFGPSKF
jgi:hypothetical protein